MLTGNKDVDRMILMRLDEKDLLNFCLVNKYAKKICNDDFWRNKFFIRYKVTNLKNENYLPKNYTWKKLCLTLVSNYERVFDDAFHSKQTNLSKLLLQDIPIQSHVMSVLVDNRLKPCLVISINYYILRAIEEDYLDFIRTVFDAIKMDKDELIDIFRSLHDVDICFERKMQAISILRKAGLPFEMFDLVYAIEREDKELAELILYSDIKDEIIADMDRVYEAAMEKDIEGDNTYINMLFAFNYRLRSF